MHLTLKQFSSWWDPGWICDPGPCLGASPAAWLQGPPAVRSVYTCDAHLGPGLLPASFLVTAEPGHAAPEWQQVRPNQSWSPSWRPSFTLTINLSVSFLRHSVAAGREVAACSRHYPMLWDLSGCSCACQ